MNQRLLAAMNSHDVDELVACFADDYASVQPAHPARAFVGAHQVRSNWQSVFSGVPDFAAELLLDAALEGDVHVGEWHWFGTHADGEPFEMRGVTVFGVAHGRIAWGRLYMEPVEQGGADIDRMVSETYRPER